MSTAQNCPRRWSRFSLRSLFVLALICACGMMTVECVRSHRREAEAREEIENLKKVQRAMSHTINQFSRTTGRMYGLLEQHGLAPEYLKVTQSYRKQDEAEDLKPAE